eukprot:3719143-Prymnesium_polylepis.1
MGNRALRWHRCLSQGVPRHQHDDARPHHARGQAKRRRHLPDRPSAKSRVVTEIFMHARRHIAAHLTEETLAEFRGIKLSAGKAQRNWKEAQTMLSSAGVLYCPVSGTPVMDLQNATDAVQSAIWEALTAISGALSGRDGGVEAALNGLRDAMAVPPPG